MHEIKWVVKKTEYAKLGRFETVFETLELTNAQEGYYSYVRFAKIGVCILPILNTGEILMIEQYRRPFNEWLYELPAGTIDTGEKPEETAKRELLEETGCIADSIIPCGHFYPSPGSTNEKIHLFAAYCHMTNQQNLEETEYIVNKKANSDEVNNMLKENKIQHAAAIILLQKFLLGEFDCKSF